MVKLQGLSNRTIKQGYLNSYLEDKQRCDMLGVWWTQLESMEVTGTKTPKEFSSILNEFQEVFKDSIQLPPVRRQVRHINLYPDHGAINVRPY
ncbi:hypothetical protein A2U01_0058974, partial [Trifolium medium]|nr:hypothetical protein [Trifolium medium]